MSDLAVLNPSGEPVFIPADRAEEAFAQGYRLETPADVKAREFHEKYGRGFGNELRAFGEGAARAATFGGSDVLFRALGVSAEDLAGRKEANPVAEGVGEVGGVLTSLLIPIPGSTAGATAKALTGGAKVLSAAEKAAAGARALEGAITPVQQIARLGKATEALAARGLESFAAKGTAEKVAARALEAFAGTAVEGAAYSAGMVLSEKALGDPDLTVSRAFGEIGMGAILGGTLGIAGAGAGAALGAGASKMKALLSEVFDADSLAKLAGQAEGKALGLAGRPGEPKVPTDVLGSWALNEEHAVLGNKPIGGAASVKSTLKNARLVKEAAGERIGAIASSLDEQLGRPAMDLADLVRPPTEGDPGGRMWREIYEPLTQSPVHNDLAEAVKGKLTEFWDAYKDGPVSFKRAREFVNSFDEYLTNKFDSPVKAPWVARALRMRGIANDAIDARMDAEIANLGGVKLADGSKVGMDGWLKAKTDFGRSAEIIRSAGKVLKGQQKHRFFSLTDQLWGLGAFGLGGIPGAVATALTNKAAREYGPQVVAAALNRVSKLEFLRSASAAAEQRFGAAVKDILASKVGGRGQQALVKRAAMDLLGAAPSSGASIGTPGAARPAGWKADLFQNNLDVIDHYATNPEALADLLDANLAPVYEVAPNVAAGMAARTARAIFYLHSIAPRNERPLNAFSTKPPPVSDLEKAKYESAVDVVTDPLRLVEHAAAGRLTRTNVQHVANAFPDDLARIQLAVLEAVAGHGDEMTYDARSQAGILLGIPGPDVASLQAPFAQLAMEQAAAMEKNAGAAANFASGLESETQGVERRRAAA